MGGIDDTTDSGLVRDPLIGYHLARQYHITAFLREEMLGRVYAAVTREGHDVSVKVLNPHMADDHELFSRFSREMLATAAIRHPNTVKMLDFGEHRIFHYIVLERIEGRTLEHAILNEGPFIVERTAHIAAQVAAGLQAAHSQGIVHRNLNSKNILLLDNALGDFVKIRDFGLASLEDSSLDDGGNITQAGVRVGTAGYMAPEYIDGDVLDSRADLYGLGVLMYEMLVGEPPFTGTPVQVMSKHVTEPPPLPSDEAAAVLPRWMDELILSLLQKDPQLRIQTASEVKRILEANLEKELNAPEVIPLERWDGKRTQPPPPARLRDDEPSSLLITVVGVSIGLGLGLLLVVGALALYTYVL